MGALLFWVVVFLLFGWLLTKAAAHGKLVKAKEEEFTASFAGWDVHITPYGQQVLGLNHETREVVLGTVSAPARYPLSAVTSVEVLRDGDSITSTNRGSQAAGAAIGAMVFGPAGLLLGGLTGSKRTRATVHEIALKLVIDDRRAPIRTVTFFKSPTKNGTDARSAVLEPFLVKAEHFHALLVNAMKSVQSSPRQSGPDTVDQIGKLWELNRAGALTDEEFSTQKAALLGVRDERNA